MPSAKAPTMSSLTVAHVLRKYDPAAWGGTETHVAALCAALPPRGFACELHAPAGPTAVDTELPAGTPIRRYHAFAPFLGPADKRRSLFDNAGNIASLDEPLRLLFDRKIALAHVHTGGRIGGAVRTAMRLSGRPYVVSLHGPKLAEPELVQRDTIRRLGGLVDVGQPLGWLFGARRVLEDAARVVVFHEAERVAAEGVAPGRVVRMDHGVDLARFEGGSAERARALHPGVGSGPVVLLVGRISEQKNQLLAVRAFARGAPADATLVFAGAATEHGYEARVRAEAHALGVAERVVFCGNVAPRDVRDLLAMATLVVLPSQHEAFGLAAVEAWAASRPMLFARRAGLAEIADALGHDEASLSTDDVATWSAAMTRWLGDAGLRAEGAARGRALVTRRYQWGAVADRLVRLYGEVLEERDTARRSRSRSEIGSVSRREWAWR